MFNALAQTGVRVPRGKNARTLLVERGKAKVVRTVATHPGGPALAAPQLMAALPMLKYVTSTCLENAQREVGVSAITLPHAERKQLKRDHVNAEINAVFSTAPLRTHRAVGQQHLSRKEVRRKPPGRGISPAVLPLVQIIVKVEPRSKRRKSMVYAHPSVPVNLNPLGKW